MVVFANANAAYPSQATRVNFACDRFAEDGEFARGAAAAELAAVPFGAMPNGYWLAFVILNFLRKAKKPGPMSQAFLPLTPQPK